MILYKSLCQLNTKKREQVTSNSLADISKLRAIGYEPKYSIQSGLDKYVKYELKE